MKKIDISESVMKKVVRFEESRSSSWLRGFYAGICAMTLLIGVFLWMSWQTISELQGWDLLTLFVQDKELIADYWQDTVMTFIQELPIETLLVTVVAIIMLLIVVYRTRKRRKVFEYRMRELAKRSEISKNSK